MYFRKMRPRTTCLYSAASMLLRSLSAASQSLASKPMLAEESLLLEERTLAMKAPNLSDSYFSVERKKDLKGWYKFSGIGVHAKRAARSVHSCSNVESRACDY